MTWWIIGAVLLTALIVFCLRLSYIFGYKAGAKKVIEIWQQTNKDMEELGDE